MIIVDVEASGVSPEKCSLLSVGAVDFANPKNRFYEECRVWDGAHVEKEALEINGFSREQITDPNKLSDREVIIAFLAWLEPVEEKTLAGQNPSFDRDFLQATAHRYHINWPLAHRTIDLHSVCWFDMLKRGVKQPTAKGHSALNLDAILKYLGLPEEPKPHNALNGALLETEAFGRLFYGKPFLEEFFKYKMLKNRV
ncbi:MAG: 3'-5' exoribonuclease [Candidatus Taylorbacteria bacterium]|nr:3'-5' exoribonuclease [Candidatus Taylorbacteria bacterium]